MENVPFSYPGRTHNWKAKGEFGSHRQGRCVSHLSHLYTCAAVQPQVNVSVVVEELLQHVQHASHLGENENSVAPSLQSSQQEVESLQLSCTGRTDVISTVVILCRSRIYPQTFSSKQVL